MSATRPALRKAEAKLDELISRYRAHGCTDTEIETFTSIVKARREVEFQRERITKPASVTAHAITPGPSRSQWQPWNNGAGKRRWFLARDTASGTKYHDGANGRLIRYVSYESARRAADRLNGVPA